MSCWICGCNFQKIDPCTTSYMGHRVHVGCLQMKILNQRRFKYP